LLRTPGPFNANAQSYNLSGAAVNFGTTTGLVNNASAGSISIANNLGGAGAQLQRLGTSTLTLSGIAQPICMGT
jgi:hypothetical protein